MKKLALILFLTVTIMCFSGQNYALAEEIALESAAAVLIEAESGQILYECNKDERRAPASVTKLMTLVVALEAIEGGRAALSDTVTASEHASSLGGSQIYLETGEQMTLQEMLIAIAVGSANDACVAVAEHLYGTQEDFVAAMNGKAQALGMKNTHFFNPYGLPHEEHYTSAYDLALLGQEALKHEMLLQLTGVKHYSLRSNTAKPFELYNTNKLLWWYSGADGFKTGWVGPESGYCLAATAEKDGTRLIAVVLGAQERHGNFRDAMKLFNYGFENYQYVPFYTAGEIITQTPVNKGASRQVTLGVAKDAGLVLAKGLDKRLTTAYRALAPLDAPVNKGQKAGVLEILNDGEVLASYDLVALEAVARCGFWEQFARVCKLVFNC